MLSAEMVVPRSLGPLSYTPSSREAFAAARVVREAGPPVAPKRRLLDRVRDAIRARHYSRRTEKAYVAWIRRYIVFHGKRHPLELGAAEITRFLSALATQGGVAASTQNQALSALLFLYRDVLEQDLPWLDGVVRAKRTERLPVVLTRDEVRAVIRQLQGPTRLMAVLLYGAGLRLLECARLRVKDVDFARNLVVVRSGKGDKDRVTLLPGTLKGDLARHLEEAKRQHDDDLQHGAGWVELPWALARKYPNAGREWAWQWVFPATRMYVDRVTASAAGISFTSPCSSGRLRTPSGAPASPSPQRATRFAMTMIYTHVLNRGPAGVLSPADRVLSL